MRCSGVIERGGGGCGVRTLGRVHRARTTRPARQCWRAWRCRGRGCASPVWARMASPHPEGFTGTRCESLRLRGFGFRVSGFGFQVSGFGFQLLQVASVYMSAKHPAATPNAVWSTHALAPGMDRAKMQRAGACDRSKRFRGGLVFKAHRWLYHSTLGSSVIKKS